MNSINKIPMREEIVRNICRLYLQGESQRRISVELGIAAVTVRKVLITYGLYTSPKITAVNSMYDSGMSVTDIAAELGTTYKNVDSILPYQKGMYHADNPTQNAMNLRAFHSRQKAIADRT